METFIPILIALVVFAFQAYSNFQKEQEKARKRNLGQPPVPPLPEENADRPATETIADMQRRETAGPQMQQSQPIRKAYESFSGFVEVDKARRVKKGHKPTLASLRVEVDEGVDSIASVGDETTFDLRDAIIKSAILERPYR